MCFHCVVHHPSTALQGAESGNYSHFTQSPERSIQLPQVAQQVGTFSPLKLSALFTTLLLSGKFRGKLKNPLSSNFNSSYHLSLLLLTDLSTRPSGPSCCPPILPAGVPPSVFLLSLSPHTTRQYDVEQSSSAGYHWPLGQFFILQGCPLGYQLSWIPATKLQ